MFFFFFSSRRRHTRFKCDWSSDVCSSDLCGKAEPGHDGPRVCRSFLTQSDDDGMTWAAPREVTREVKRATEVTSNCSGPGIGIQLARGKHAGRVLIPFNQGPYGKWKVYAAWSDDGGKSWRYGDT